MSRYQGIFITVRPVAGRDWRLWAACRFTDPELFFPVSNSGQSLNQVTEAKKVCAACVVLPECLAFAMRTQQVHGIWGGMTEEERSAVPFQPDGSPIRAA
jgi:WhiB family redox-sensing transcriptional regulator